MSVYNGEKYLAEAIESILGQTFTDFEFIIINDGSSDRSVEIIQEYGKQDGRIRLIENENNIGLALSLNKGIDAARGRYIARMDADDISLPDRFAIQVNYLESHQEIWVLGSSIQIIDEKGRVMRQVDYPSDPGVLRWNMMLGAEGIVCHPACMLRKELFEAVGYYKNFPTSQDLELWTRLFFMEDLHITNLRDVLFSSRNHADQVSTGRRDLQFNTSNEIRIQLMNRFMNKSLPKDVSTAYREIRREKFSGQDLRFYLDSWLEIYQKFITTFELSEEACQIIRKQLLFIYGTYLSFNPIHVFSRKEPSLWKDLITNRYLSFRDYGYLFSVNRGFRKVTSELIKKQKL